MESATTAESRLSMPPSSAKETALGSSAASRSRVISGRPGKGKVCGMPPKREPMVSTGRPASADTAVTAAIAMRKTGHFGR